MKELLGEMHGEQLARMPKGFCAEDPAADLLKFKRFIRMWNCPRNWLTRRRSSLRS